MSSTDDNNGPLSLDTPIDEDRVRRALGLKTGGPVHQHQQRPEQARQRHKFITDGAVPVVMLNRSDAETVSLRERLQAAEAALENERGAHAATKRALHDLQMAHQMLQTQKRHNDMAQADQLNAERDARRVAEEALAAAMAALQAKPAVPSEAAPTPAPVVAETMAAAEAAPASVAPARRARAPGIKLTAPKSAKEPKPVRWWTPSYRAKK